jgi:hypothetical protein
MACNKAVRLIQGCPQKVASRRFKCAEARSKFKVCPQEAAELRFKVPSSKFKNGHQAVYVIFDNLWKLTGISVKYKTPISTNWHKLF